MSELGHTLLPAVEAALRNESGEFRKPQDSFELAKWLRACGCPNEATRVEGNEELCKDLIAWIRKQPS